MMEKYIPHKTPYVLFDNFKKLISNNSFCEIGCGWGYSLNYIKNNFNVSKIGGIEVIRDKWNIVKKGIILMR